MLHNVGLNFKMKGACLIFSPNSFYSGDKGYGVFGPCKAYSPRGTVVEINVTTAMAHIREREYIVKVGWIVLNVPQFFVNFIVGVSIAMLFLTCILENWCVDCNF